MTFAVVLKMSGAHFLARPVIKLESVNCFLDTDFLLTWQFRIRKNVSCYELEMEPAVFYRERIKDIVVIAFSAIHS